MRHRTDPIGVRMRRRKLLTRLAHKLPAVVLLQPWAIWIKALCIISGLTTFLGPAPGAIETALPRPVVAAWSLTLVLGASAGLYGLLRPRGRRWEIVGLIWLGTAALVYAATLASRFGLGGLAAAGIVLTFGLVALVRALAVYVSYEIARQVRDQDEGRR